MFFTYHLFEHIPYSLTRFSQMPLFKSANLLRSIVWLPSPLFQGAPSHRSNTSIATDATLPGILSSLSGILECEFWGEKTLWGASVSCKCFPSVSNAVLSILISALLETWSESLCSEYRKQKQTQREGDQREHWKTEGSEVQSCVGLYKAQLSEDKRSLPHHGSEAAFWFGQKRTDCFGKVSEVHLWLPTRYKTEDWESFHRIRSLKAISLNNWAQFFIKRQDLIFKLLKTLLPDLQLACSTWTQLQSENCMQWCWNNVKLKKRGASLELEQGSRVRGELSHLWRPCTSGLIYLTPHL